jgi:transposase
MLFGMKPTPIELRRRIVNARIVDKQSMGRIAVRFQIPKGTVQNILEQYRDTGSVEPRPQNAGRKSVFRSEDLSALERDVRKHPDATLEELRERSKVKASLVTFHNALKKLEFVRKKKRYVPSSKDART